MNSMKKIVSISMFALLAAACGSGNDNNNENMPRGAYPAGPYGKTEGAILEALTFVNPDGSEHSLNSIWAAACGRT